MQKKGLIIFSLILLMSFVFMFGVFAQDTTNTNVVENNLPVEVPENTLASSVGYVSPEGEEVDLTEDDEVEVLVEEANSFDEQLSVDAGITPGSPLSFIDNAFDGFANPADVREEKIAEMRDLGIECNAGNQEACGFMEESFNKYQKYAGDFEREVSPEERESALQSSRAIRGVAIRDIAQNMPPEQKDEFVREIVLGEKDIETAAEIASKISELCSQLSKLDPGEYSRVCKIERDAPDWRKKLDADLTEEQRAEALKFGEIMSQCFESAGQNCKCEEISYPDFAEACSVAAPLATACEIENNEDACEQLDDLEMPELPDYLQDIMDDLESGMSEDKYGMFLPPECEDAGAKSPKECAEIMIGIHSPKECRQALLDANVQSEREGREICDEIMFERNAPSECVEAGITNPEECGKFMFGRNAPKECIDAGLDGSDRNDPMACRKLMESQFREGPEGCAPGTICVPGSQWAPGTGPNIKNSGGDCRSISDPMKRLECYEGATQYVQEFRGDFEEKFRDTQTQQNNCARDCGAKNSAWNFENGNCVCKAPNFQEFEQRHVDNFIQDFNQDYSQQFRGDFKDGQFQPPQGMMPPQQFQQPQDYQQQDPQPGTYQQPPEGYQQPPQDYQQPTEQPTTSTTETQTSSDTTTESSPSSSGSSESPDSSGGDSGGSDGGSITGGVISNSGFLRYWFFG